MRSIYAPQTESLTPDAPLWRRSQPRFSISSFAQGPITHEELDAAVRRFKKAMIERALGGELTHHLGYPPGGSQARATRPIIATGPAARRC